MVISGHCRQRRQCLSRPWRVEVSAVAFSSLRHPVLTPFTRWDSLATLCHRRCRETLSRSLGPCGFLGWRPEGTSSRPSWLVGQRVRVRPAASSTVRLVFSFGMRLACPPATAGSQRTCPSFLADLSASLLDLLGTLRRATALQRLVQRWRKLTDKRHRALSSWRWSC